MVYQYQNKPKTYDKDKELTCSNQQQTAQRTHLVYFDLMKHHNLKLSHGLAL